MADLNGPHVDAIGYFVHRCWALEEATGDGNRTNEEQMKLKSFAEEGLKLLETLPSVIASRTGPQANIQVVKTVNVLGALDHHGDAIAEIPHVPVEFAESELTVERIIQADYRAGGHRDDVLVIANKYATETNPAKKAMLRRALILMLEASEAFRLYQTTTPPAHGNDI